MHIEDFALVVLFDEVRFGGVGLVDHHGYVAVGELEIQEILYVSLAAFDELFGEIRLSLFVFRNADHGVHRPERVPVPKVAVVGGTRVNKGIFVVAVWLFHDLVELGKEIVADQLAVGFGVGHGGCSFMYR